MNDSPLRMLVCADCGWVQYPRRDICCNCLGAELVDSPVSEKGTVIARSELHHSLDPFFVEQLPWMIVSVKLQCGPMVIAHAHPDTQLHCATRIVPVAREGGSIELAAVPVDSKQADLKWNAGGDCWEKEEE